MKIEKGIPLVTVNPASKYPWDEMEVGDSFRANVKPDSLRGAAHNQAKRYGRKFVVRKDGNGARAWRVE